MKMKTHRTPSTQRGWEKSIVINDIHIPFEDKRAVKLVFDFIEWFKPDRVFINGDLLDCQTVGRFVNDPFHEVSMVDEIVQGREFLEKLRSILKKNAKIHYIYGNHEFRFQNYIINNARSLRGLEGLTLKEQLYCDDYGVDVVYSGLRESYMQYGKLFVGHYNKVSKHGGYTVKSLIDDKGVSVIHGHTHRFGTHYRTLLDGTVLGGFENGCLCDLNPNYTMKPNWIHGFSIVWKKKDDDRFMVEPVPIINHKFFYGGIEWEG
jgi:UDP-2,3-diacylglucosamine pyrophosphatase LpxH